MSGTTFRLLTDQNDYAPGSTAIITADGLTIGTTLTMNVQHVAGAGLDGLYGTSDDEVLDLGGAGHETWTVTDGGEGDLDGLANGTIVTSWYVNPDDSANQTFVLTATETASGQDGILGTSDDVFGASTAAVFTDAVIDLTTDGSSGTANGAYFVQSGAVSSAGTGLIEAFVRLQNGGTEDGFNTDDRPIEDSNGNTLSDINTSPSFTKSLELSAVPIVDPDAIAGTGKFFEFRLDINQLSNSPLLSLDRLQLYLGNSATLNNFNTDPLHAGDAFGSAAQLVYNLDAGANNTIYLNYNLEPGSGKSDMYFYVPVELVYGADGVAGGAGANVDLINTSIFNYVYLYSEFGSTGGAYATNDGFEEWSVSKTADVVISGYKWEDSNGNGAWDAGEHGLEGWEILVDYDNDGTWDGAVYTDATGYYEIPIFVLPEDKNSVTITVGETVQLGWTNTYDGPDVGTDGKTQVTITNPAGQGLNNLQLPIGDFGVTEVMNFGNFKNISISGLKYTDTNGDGSLSGDSPGTPGQTFTINLYTFTDADDDGVRDAGEALTFVSTTETDATTGAWAFGNLGPLAGLQKYYVAEAGETGWTQTVGTDGYVTDPTSGVNDTNNDFGNFKNISISGLKYTDTNGDGSLSGDSPGTPGQTFTINLYTFTDADDDGVRDAGEALTFVSTTETDATTGAWAFGNLGPLAGLQKYYVAEAGETGWTQTVGTDGYVTDPTSGVNDTNNDFGNFKNISISGLKYTDTNGDGSISGDPAGTPGQTFTIGLYSWIDTD
ncbi:hypothetical protein, partial [Neoroseomonas oryzicola]